MKISVIITSYNQVDLLKEAIDSVLFQSLKPYELIICDDASSDASLELINSYQREYPNLIKGYSHAKNIGISRNRNFGLKLSTGDYVTWLDGDDVFRYCKLKQEIDAINKNGDVKWAYSQVLEVNYDAMRFLLRYTEPNEGRIFNHVVKNLGTAPKNPLVDRTIFDQIGSFDSSLGMYEDFDFSLRLAANYKCKYCPIPGMEYRINTIGLSSANPRTHMENLNKIIEKFEIYTNGTLVDPKKNHIKDFLHSLRVLSIRMKISIIERKILNTIPLFVLLYAKKLGLLYRKIKTNL